MGRRAESIISLLRKLKEVETLSIGELRDIVGDSELFELLVAMGHSDLGCQRVSFNLESRFEISSLALECGVDVEEVCKLLSWREFESFSKSVLEKNNYSCIQNFRFKINQKRYEIDVVGVKEPLILCIDSKHYRKTSKHFVLIKCCEKQVERIEAFSRALPKMVPKLGITKWKEAKIIPLIVTLLTEEIASLKVPIVPFFKLNSFIMDLPSYLSDLYHINVKLSKLEDYVP
ncbi:MAG: hypothetical protein QXO71_03860 [Candidatus Jordarchaeaceae archaeon]